jgi:hypothetical protein
MTYLGALRFHFAGRFLSDPSTVNNHPAHYDNETFDRSKHWQPGIGGSPNHGWWNPKGRNLFRFEGVTVRSATLADGRAAAASDPILGCRLETKQPPGRMVDLDPDQQLTSMIFGVVLELVGSGGVALQGAVEPVPFTDIWRRGESGAGDMAASVAYQSVISVSAWGELSASEFLQQLRHAAGEDLLSIKFNLDGYSMRSSDTAEFAKGRIVGTVGPAASHEPRHFVAGRHFGNEVHPLGTAFPGFRPVGGVNYFPSLMDAERGRLRLDLGNALPVEPAGGPVHDIGELQLGRRNDDGTLSEIAEIPYGGAGWYEKTAGIVEVPNDHALTGPEMEVIERSALCVVARREGQRRIVSDEARAHVRADLFVARLNPGEAFTVRFWASRRGQPLANARINLFLLLPQDPEARQNFPVGGLRFLPSVECNEHGMAEATLVASDPGEPRFFYRSDPAARVQVDGQVYRIGYEVDGHTQPNPSNILSILVWNTFVADEPPTWHGSMRAVFTQFGNLYPSMTSAAALDLADYEQVAARRQAIIRAIRREESTARYMPVTRDLSDSRKDAMIRWLENLGSDGKPLLGVAPAPAAVPEAVPAEIGAEAVQDVGAEIEPGSKTIAGQRTEVIRP